MLKFTKQFKLISSEEDSIQCNNVINRSLWFISYSAYQQKFITTTYKMKLIDYYKIILINPNIKNYSVIDWKQKLCYREKWRLENMCLAEKQCFKEVLFLMKLQKLFSVHLRPCVIFDKNFSLVGSYCCRCCLTTLLF